MQFINFFSLIWVDNNNENDSKNDLFSTITLKYIYAFAQLTELNVIQKESAGLWAKLLNSKQMRVKDIKKALT